MTDALTPEESLIAGRPLAGQHVVVIGGSSGIGLAVAGAARAAGADVTVGSRRGERGADGLHAVAVDVTDDASVERAFAGLDSLDHLVCTAASGFPGGLLRAEPDEVRGLMESKFWGQYRCVRAAAPLLGEGGSITLTSGIRSRRPIRGSGAFTAVNMAVEGMVRALAVELAPVRVNGLAPGTVDTPVFDALPADVRARRLEGAAAQTTVGRVGTAAEAAQVVLLCMTNAFMSGAVIDVDGGGLLACSRIAVVGAGAMGSVFGAQLALAGHAVTLVDVRADHVDAVRRDGLLLHGGDGGPRRVALAATTDPAGLGALDLILVLTKSFATEDAARAIVPAVAAGTWIVTLQNGLGNDWRLASVLGEERVVPGTTTVGAEQDGPGMTRMSPSTASGATATHLGPPRGAAAMPEPVRAIARTLTDAGLPAEARADADVVIWTKVALAGPMGCLSALLRRTVLDTYEDPRSRRVLRDLFDEIVAVAGAHGVRLDPDATWEHAEGTFRAVGRHTASMAADVLAGRRTEIDALCLEVARLGEERAVPTPVNRTVGLAVKAIEATYERALSS